ncbi:MAG: hypothetical protein IE926_12305 [Micrococcales bacterium]|nr:hypothetical protein [Micrococcales bacterium]
MTTLPTWAVYAVSLGTPVLTFLGVLLAQWIARRGDVELEARSKREETMRTMRWAAELSAGGDQQLANLGVAELSALLESDLLDDSEKVFVEAALDAVYDDVEAEIERLGEEVEVVQYVAESGGGLATGAADDVSFVGSDREGDERRG